MVIGASTDAGIELLNCSEEGEIGSVFARLSHVRSAHCLSQFGGLPGRFVEVLALLEVSEVAIRVGCSVAWSANLARKVQGYQIHAHSSRVEPCDFCQVIPCACSCDTSSKGTRKELDCVDAVSSHCDPDRPTPLPKSIGVA
jgi:hypothetical protein